MSTLNQKPNVRAVRASVGSLGAVDVDRIQEGWVEEIPPSEVANWIDASLLPSTYQNIHTQVGHVNNQLQVVQDVLAQLGTEYPVDVAG